MTDVSGDTPLTGKAATQQRILVAAARLFVDRGFEKTTISDVAALAGVSRATVFWHFSDKGGLFRESLSFLVRPFRESLERDRAHLEPEKRLLEQVGEHQNVVALHRETIEGFLRLATETPGMRDWIVESLLDLHQRFAGVLSETLAEIVPESDDPGALAAGLVSLLDGALILSLFDSSEKSVEQRRRGVEALVALISQRL